MLKLLLTFDYELFFGRMDATESEILIVPTEKIINILKIYKVNATFFVDVCANLRYEKEKKYAFLGECEKQIKSLFKQGFDIQLHLHPIWLKAKYQDDQWKIDNRYYRLHAFQNENANSISQIVFNGVTYLETLLHSVDKSYKCIAFRAGGFCLQPEKDIVKSLLKNGILIDSSVCKGIGVSEKAFFYDYYKTPLKENWWFRSDVQREGNNGEGCFEIPVGSFGKKPQKWILTRTNKRLQIKKLSGEITKKSNKASLLGRAYQRLQHSWKTSIMYSLDSCNYRVLIKFINNELKKVRNDKKDTYLAIIGHPKLFGEDQLENLRLFLHEMKTHYPEVEFISMTEVYNILRFEDQDDK